MVWVFSLLSKIQKTRGAGKQQDISRSTSTQKQSLKASQKFSSSIQSWAMLSALQCPTKVPGVMRSSLITSEFYTKNAIWRTNHTRMNLCHTKRMKWAVGCQQMSILVSTWISTCVNMGCNTGVNLCQCRCQHGNQKVSTCERRSTICTKRTLRATSMMTSPDRVPNFSITVWSLRVDQ